MSKIRCAWVKNELDAKYHDTEWGRILHDEQKLFEFLILEGMQAGLSWSTILKKRENFKRAFDNFDYKICANYTDEYLESLQEDKGIIRHRLKIRSVRKNAQAFLKVQEEYGTFDKYIWGFVNHKQIVIDFKNTEVLESLTALFEKISKDMKKRGFTFVGSTIIYSYMQAIGIVNGHSKECFCYEECKL